MIDEVCDISVRNILPTLIDELHMQNKCSIYAVQDSIGNVREITLSSPVGERRSFGVKGSSCIASLETSSCARVEAFKDRSIDIGFRVVMENMKIWK